MDTPQATAPGTSPNARPQRIVVTGASGNVGTAVLRRLARDGHDLVALARRPPGRDRIGPAADWRSIDLTSEACLGPLEAAFAGAGAVVHLAWGFQPSHDEAYLRELGVGGTRRVIDAVIAAGVPHFVHQSSVGAYAPKRDDEPVTESWPTTGVPSSMYSRHKAAAERLVDELEASGHPVAVARTRPGVVGQWSAGSALLRYGLPAVVPARAIRVLPVLPVDRRLKVPLVHADDVAEAIARIIERRATGAFNLAADPPIGRDDIARVLGARPVHVPSTVLRPLVDLTWRARLQKVDAGWLDMAFATPLLDCGRAREVLGWTPETDALSVLAEVVDAMAAPAAGGTPVLRRRTIASELRALAARGPAAMRRKP